MHSKTHSNSRNITHFDLSLVFANRQPDGDDIYYIYWPGSRIKKNFGRGHDYMRPRSVFKAKDMVFLYMD